MYQEDYEKVMKSLGKTKEEVKAMIKKEIHDLSGLIDEEGALTIIIHRYKL